MVAACLWHIGSTSTPIGYVGCAYNLLCIAAHLQHVGSMAIHVAYVGAHISLL